MNQRCRPLLLAALATSCSLAAYAQAPADPVKTRAFRGEVILNVLQKVKARHYAPRQLDDIWSAAVWKSYIRLLDPNRNVFLREDIQRFTAMQQDLDNQLAAGQTTFFDSVYATYQLRMQENKQIVEKISGEAFDVTRQETLVLNTETRDYPASVQEKESLWRKLLKYQVLRNYMEQQTAAGNTQTTTDTAAMAKARGYIRKWHNDQFRLAAAPNAEDEKFSQYVAVALIEIDPHTVYSGPKDKTMEQQISKRYFGLGMELAEKEADFYVKRLMSGGTAARSGAVKENDNIISISDANGNMVPVSGLTAVEVTRMIRGEKDTEVKMMLRQPGDTARTVAIKRGEVIDQENRARGAVIEKNGKKFGYLSLPLFYLDPTGQGLTGSFSDVAREVEKLKEQEVEGIVFDLRGNGGGSLEEVVRMSSIFLPSGPVTWLRTQQQVNRYNSPAVPPSFEGPLVVMVDESSASASEIFAAVIQDRRRGLIAGPASTYGKGTAQATVNVGKLGDATLGTPDISYGSMRLTVQKFYRVTGTSTQLNGVVPDVILQETMRTTEKRERTFASSLPCDTLQLPAFEAAGPHFNYDLVVRQARERIAANPAFTTITAQMNHIREHALLPAPLDISSFRQYYGETARSEKIIRNARTLPAEKVLPVELPVNRSIHPDLRKEETAGANVKEWLKTISQDVYIDASLAMLADMIAHPPPAKK
ncbi:PDZ domain-containing protein [Chitinophaga sp. Mgbs1]|uniref:PDZ domain-containing protein n=1 Tax=Chitinophaga solisilvae TaxID=1233460 RepID=A0A3S1CT56_9BACT|nr:PDZ domain-containing protein [Chitinophaga solisilvae]